MPKKPRRGRPPLKPDSRRSYKLSVTIRERLRRQLEQSAEEEGRTLSQEVEYRIERSFERAELMWEMMELAYGREAAALLVVMARAMADAGRASGYRHSPTGNEGASWLDDRFAYEQAQKAAATILEKFKPPKWTEQPNISNERFLETMRVLTKSTDSKTWGEWFAKNVLDGLRGEESTVKDQRWINRTKDMLGPLFDRLPKPGADI